MSETEQRLTSVLSPPHGFVSVGDQQALFTPITKKTWAATSADRVREMVREAF